MTGKPDSGYTDAREELRSAELELMLQRERVAEMRRSLPPGPVVDNYIFDEGPAELSADGPYLETSMLQLCRPGRPLVLYHFMYGKAQRVECPMCAMWADGWDAVARQVDEMVDFAVVASAPIADWRAVAAARGWSNLRLLSAGSSTFKADIGGEDHDGNQMSFLSVYERDGDDVRLSYSGGVHIEADHMRGLDLLSPVWHLFDLTRAGRGDWMASHTVAQSLTDVGD